eukprot:1688491-Amphidinium_carterae.1
MFFVFFSLAVDGSAGVAQNAHWLVRPMGPLAFFLCARSWDVAEWVLGHQLGLGKVTSSVALPRSHFGSRGLGPAKEEEPTLEQLMALHHRVVLLNETPPYVGFVRQ